MTKFKFSVGPWNVHSGVDSYGPATRNEIDFEEKIRKFAELGFSAIQFHDDDAVPNINDYTEEEIKEKARELKRMLDKYGLAAEFVAPRLWMDGRTADGGFMSTSQEDREYAMWRAYRSIDIAKELGCNMVVLWLAREGTLCAESKSPVWATKMLIHAINKMLEYDSDIRICIEPKPNEPIDRSICVFPWAFCCRCRQPPLTPSGWAETWRAPTPSWPVLTLPMKSDLPWQWGN